MKFRTLAAVLVLVCCGGNGTITGPDDGEPPPPGPGPLSYIDLANPTLVQPITAGDMQAGRTYKFVAVEVVEVVNPQRYALMFEVHYEPPGGQRILLGAFALYPANNPGRFIVPTQGRVSNEGTLLLTMTSPDTNDRTDQVRVGLRRMTFMEG